MDGRGPVRDGTRPDDPADVRSGASPGQEDPPEPLHLLPPGVPGHRPQVLASLQAASLRRPPLPKVVDVTLTRTPPSLSGVTGHPSTPGGVGRRDRSGEGSGGVGEGPFGLRPEKGT